MEIFKDIENSGFLVISLSADCSIEKSRFNFYLPVVVWHSDCSGHNFNYFQYLMLDVDVHPFSSYLKFVALELDRNDGIGWTDYSLWQAWQQEVR